MRFVMALALPLLLVSCDKKEETKSHAGHGMPVAAGDKVKDPVCKMDGLDKAATIKHTHEGTDYYFCNEECLTKFKADPKKYAIPCLCSKTSKKCDCGHCTPKGETCDCHS